MSQPPPNYVVRQETGGKLKLLLVRDPRATHVAKISPVKASETTPRSAHVPSSSTTLSETATASSRGGDGSGAPSPSALTQAASEAMALAHLVRVGDGSAAVQREGRAEGARVKGGRIAKPQSPPILVPKKLSKHLSTARTTSSDSAHITKPQHSATSHDSIPIPKRTMSSPKHHTLLPMSRVRTIMRTNVQSVHRTQTVSQDSVTLVTKATEHFIAQLAKEAHTVAMAAAKRDIVYGHLAKAVRKSKRTSFLHDVIPQKVLVSDYLASLGNTSDHTHDESHTSSSSN